jgi:hypothetical protein
MSRRVAHAKNSPIGTVESVTERRDITRKESVVKKVFLYIVGAAVIIGAILLLASL